MYIHTQYIPPMSDLEMSIEKYDKVLLVDKKNYAYIIGKEVYIKGLSVVRKDRVMMITSLL